MVNFRVPLKGVKMSIIFVYFTNIWSHKTEMAEMENFNSGVFKISSYSHILVISWY